MSPPESAAGLPPKAALLASELQQRVICFAAGDELYAGEWLTSFQRTEGAWDVCVDALRPGPQATCDAELLQEFCAQTLARLARSFAGQHPPASRIPQRDALGSLLVAHVGAEGKPGVWRQLALALVCADLWLGSWAPPQPGPQLPGAVRRELLALPAQLLFSDRALPLDEPHLRMAAASSLLNACDIAFAELLQGGAQQRGEQAKVSLQALSDWLRALRKALRLLPAQDPAIPLRALAAHGDALLALTMSNPAEAAELVQQLARWRCKGCSSELSILLQALLQHLFGAASGEFCPALIPLLSDLAAGCWPQAVLGDFVLDWSSVAVQALAAIRMAVEGGGDEDGEGSAADAAAALSIWQTFAETVREGTQPGLDLLEEDSPGASARPEKRSRVFEEEEWRPSPEQIAQCHDLAQLFGQFASELLELLRVPPDPQDVEGLMALQEVREAAAAALATWAPLVGHSPLWQEATWVPLQQLKLGDCSLGPLPNCSYCEAEAVLWFSGTLAGSCSLGAVAGCTAQQPPPAAAVLELSQLLDGAPEQWRALLWSAASSLAATGPPDLCQQLLDWTLQRPPMSVCMPELMQLVELPYAESVEKLCRPLLASGSTCIPVGDRLATLAFETRPEGALHEDSGKAQSLLLLAMRHSMGTDEVLLCQGLAQKVIPGLCQAAEAEAKLAPAETDPPWRAAQALFGTLAATLPSTCTEASKVHPALALWREKWPYVEAALLSWPASAVSDQPLAAASEALASAASVLPELLPQAVQVLAASATKHELPELQLQALSRVLAGDACRIVDARALAELLGTSLLPALEVQLQRNALPSSPSTLGAFFKLLCAEQLRPLIIKNPAFGEICFGLIVQVLPNSTSAPAAAAQLRFAAALVGSSREEISAEAAFRHMLLAVLPGLCKALCEAMAALEHLADLESEGTALETCSLAQMAELLLRCSTVLPEELSQDLSAGLRANSVAEWTGERLLRHLAGRADWPRKTEWLGQLEQIVREWQRERRRATLL